MCYTKELFPNYLCNHFGPHSRGFGMLTQNLPRICWESSRNLEFARNSLRKRPGPAMRGTLHYSLVQLICSPGRSTSLVLQTHPSNWFDNHQSFGQPDFEAQKRRASLTCCPLSETEKDKRTSAQNTATCTSLVKASWDLGDRKRPFFQCDNRIWGQ